MEAELAANVVADFLDDLALTRETLDPRYEDSESSRVALVPAMMYSPVFRQECSPPHRPPMIQYGFHPQVEADSFTNAGNYIIAYEPDKHPL